MRFLGHIRETFNKNGRLIDWHEFWLGIAHQDLRSVDLKSSFDPLTCVNSADGNFQLTKPLAGNSLVDFCDVVYQIFDVLVE